MGPSLFLIYGCKADNRFFFWDIISTRLDSRLNPFSCLLYCLIRQANDRHRLLLISDGGCLNLHYKTINTGCCHAFYCYCHILFRYYPFFTVFTVTFVNPNNPELPRQPQVIFPHVFLYQQFLLCMRYFSLHEHAILFPAIVAETG